MTGEDHVQLMGKLLGNLQGLELAVRAFLANRPGARKVQEGEGLNLLELPVGSELPESDVTSFSYFSDLVVAFNREAEKVSKPQIDLDVVEVRNALAHGSVFGKGQAFPMRLLRLSRPTANRVTLLMNVEMSEEWFRAKIEEVFDAIQLVHGELRP